MAESYINFKDEITDFYNYLQTRSPGNLVLTEWFESLKYLGIHNIRKCIDHMKSNYSGIPKNLPKEIKSIHYANNVKDNTKGDVIKEPCPDCNGTGIFKLAMYDKSGVYFEPIKFCSNCNNYKNIVNDPGQRISKKSLEALGIRFKPFNKVLSYPHLTDSNGSIHKYKKIARNFAKNHSIEANV